MRVAVKVLGLFIALFIIIATIPALIPDEEYSAGAQRWLNDANNPEVLPDEVNRFNALVGFNVTADKDMIAEGARLIAEVNAQFSDEARKSNDAPEFNDYWARPPLETNNNLSSRTSAAFKDNPAQWLLENHDKYNASISGNRILLDRFRQLMTMTQFSYTMKLDINAPSIRYNDLLAIKRLDNLSIIDEFLSANKQNAIQRLQKNISSSKLMMKQSALLLDKMIAAEFLKIDLLTYSSILDQAPADNSIKFNITNLQTDESDMLNAFKGEYAFLSTSLDIENSYRFNAGTAETDLLEEFLIKYYLKRKRVENNAYKNRWLPFLGLKDQSCASRKTIVEAIGEKELSWWQIYQDPLGYVFAAIAMPSYFDYIDTIDHADATISLLNLKTSIYSNRINSDNVENYISSANAVMNAGYAGAKFSWNKEKREISYDLPGYTDDGIPRISLYIKRRS